MFKALKRGVKKLGSSGSKLNEQGSREPAPPAAPATHGVSAAPPPLPPPAFPTGLPPRSPHRPASPQLVAPAAEGAQPRGQQVAAPPAGPLAAPTSASGTAAPAAAPAMPASAAGSAASLGDSSADASAVDYELVAGPLELDGAGTLAGGGDESPGPLPPAAAECGESEQHPSPREVCYGTGGPSGGPSPEEEAAAAALLAEAEASGSGAGGGGAAAAAADASGGGGGEPAGSPTVPHDAEAISDALATMMYLTEDAEGADDCVSVVSDARSDDDLPDDISELSRALEALEGEALGSSPGASTSGAPGVGGLEDRLAEQLGLSPDADPTAFSQQMAKLYNNLGLKMMERRKHEEALGLLRKAEAVVDNDAVWQQGRGAAKRQRMRAITYNNLGCLFKRRNMPQLALQYLQKALALEEGVQNLSSTHLNICAANSALKRPKEALSHAERAIILLQRHLWAHSLPFQDGLNSLVRSVAAAPGTPSTRHLLASANVLAMAYHNAAVEHEKLGRLREALVSFTRAYLIASKCLGHKAPMTVSLSRALKAFQQRQARHLPTGAAHAARKAPTLASSRSAAAAKEPKRGVAGLTGRPSSKSVASSKSAASLSSKAVAGSSLPLDKGRTTGSMGSLGSVRPPSSSRLAGHLQPPAAG